MISFMISVVPPKIDCILMMPIALAVEFAPDCGGGR